VRINKNRKQIKQEREHNMKMKTAALIAGGVIAAGLWGYGQQMGPQNTSGCPWMTQAQMQHVQNHPMMGWYMHMGQIQLYPESPTSIVAWKNELGLSDIQAGQLKAIEERAIADAKAALTDEQKAKLATLTKGLSPMSMDHCWTMINP
jgi:hypothetical protein